MKIIAEFELDGQTCLSHYVEIQAEIISKRDPLRDQLAPETRISSMVEVYLALNGHLKSAQVAQNHSHICELPLLVGD